MESSLHFRQAQTSSMKRKERNNFMCPTDSSETAAMSRNNDNYQLTDGFNHATNDTKYFVDLYTAALHLRQRMKEEKLIHNSYSAYFNDENNNNNMCSVFHNCFHSYDIINWLIKRQLCKTIGDGIEVFEVLQKLKLIHHVCDLHDFEYPPQSSSQHNVKYLYRFRLDDGTADQNRSFHQFASIYETYISLFTLDKSQCRGVDLQKEQMSGNPYDENSGILLKGDNLARMVGLRVGGNMANIQRLIDSMIVYGLVRFSVCDLQSECSCLRKFRNDEHHQYLLSNTHHLVPKQRLDIVALMQNDTCEILQSPILNETIRTSPSSNSINSDDSTRKVSNTDENESTIVVPNATSGFRRKKSASLNSTANSEHRPTAEELEKLESPWCWKSYSLKRDRSGYGLILQGQGPCYVERLDPYGSAFTSGIRVNDYLFAVEGINVLRRSGKEVERLLSMFDKCTVYTVYNRDELRPGSSLRNDLISKQEMYRLGNISSPISDYTTNANSRKGSLTAANHSTTTSQQNQQQSYSSSPTSSVDGVSSCSISPKYSQPYANTRKGVLLKHFQFFRLPSRSFSNTLK